MSNNKPTVQALDECLKNVVSKWERFALYLPRITQTELDIIEENKRGDVVGKKLELYKVWLKRYPNASWDDVSKALKAVGENSIAEQLQNYLTKADHQSFSEVVSHSIPNSSGAIPMSPSQTTTTEEVTVREEVVMELNTLQQLFVGLAHNVKTEVKTGAEKGNIDIKSVTLRLQEERAFPIPSLDSVTTSDELFKAIHPHYNFLNCYLIVSIALSFLSTAIAEKATKYKEKVLSFMKTTKIRSLQNTLKRYSRMFRDRSNTTAVEIAVENRWEEQDLWLVRKLITALFPVKHPDELPWYDIVPGSVVMTFIALEHMTPSLIESSRKKTEFMRLIGVISLKIGDELVWKKESEGNKNPFSFQDSLIQATLADNIEAVQFLLQYIRVNINTRNTTNTLINAGDEEIYRSQENVNSSLKSHHATFTALLKDVEYEFQYVQGRMTAVDNDSNSSSPVADGDSKSTHRPRDNFLNGRVLAGLSYQLPEPLSTWVKQYQATIDGRTKRKSLLIHLSSSLVKYFPTPFPDSIEVILTLHSVWRACSVWYVEQLGQLIFTPTLFHKLQWFRVDSSEESLRVVLLADKELMDSLTKACLANDESLTPLLGVISVRVDDTVVISNDYSNGYTFNEAMHLAKAMGNDEISDLLLQIQQSPVDFIQFGIYDKNNNLYLLPEPDSTPLMIACCNDNSQLVQLLLYHNANPNIQTRHHGYTALTYSTGNSKIFQMLLDCGANIEACDDFNAVLYCACSAGNVKVVKKILAKNPSAGLLHLTFDRSRIPLIVASFSGHTAIVRKLLEAKADPNLQNNEGHTALQSASRYGHAEIVGMILQANVNPNIQNNEGWTALNAASRYGHTEIVGMLLQAKADPNIQDNEGWTALNLASRYGHIEIVGMLLQANVNSNIQNNEGWTALNLASRYGHIEIVRMLLQANVNPDIQNKEGWTALHQASCYGHTKIVQFLLQGKTNPSLVNNDGLTAQKLAERNNHRDIIKEFRSVSSSKCKIQ